MKNAVCFFIFLSFFISCTNSGKKELFADADFRILSINPECSEEKLMSELFDSIRYIVLEEKMDFLVGQIDKLEIFNSVIYVLDKKNKQLLSFSMEGEFICSYGRKGQGPGEYIKISDFAIDAKRKELLILDRDLKRVLKYDLIGNYLGSTSISMMGCHLEVDDDNYWLYTRGADHFTKNKNSFDYNLFSMGLENGSLREFIDYDDISNRVLLDHTFDKCYNQSSILFYYALCDTIYSIKEKPIPTFLIDFGKSALDVKSINKKELSSFLNKSAYARLVNVCHSEDFLVLNYVYNNRIHFVLSNYQKDELVNCSFLKNDIDRTSFALAYPAKILDRRCFFVKEAKDLLKSYQRDTVEVLSHSNTIVKIVENSNPVVVVGYLK